VGSRRHGRGVSDGVGNCRLNRTASGQLKACDLRTLGALCDLHPASSSMWSWYVLPSRAAERWVRVFAFRSRGMSSALSCLWSKYHVSGQGCRAASSPPTLLGAVMAWTSSRRLPRPVPSALRRWSSLVSSRSSSASEHRTNGKLRNRRLGLRQRPPRAWSRRRGHIAEQVGGAEEGVDRGMPLI
jgi:hypothetical protein